MNEYIFFALTGIFAGTAAGLLGIGGGIIVVPCLFYIFSHLGSEPNLAMHMAIATSLATMVFTASSSFYSHHLRGLVEWSILRQLIFGLLIGTVLGVLIAASLSTVILKTIFATFLLFVALRMFLFVNPKSSRQLPGVVGMNVAGVSIGLLSGMLGIGGGPITVPFLVWCNVNIRQAAGISAACGLPIAIVGAISSMIAGWGVTASQLAIGYVYLPAALTIACTSVLAVFLGAHLSIRLPVIFIKRIFAIVLLFAALDLLGLFNKII